MCDLEKKFARLVFLPNLAQFKVLSENENS